MPIHESFPRNPYQVIPPEYRWYPGATELRAEDASKLAPPLVARIREEVNRWRATGYSGASDTSRRLLTYWFEQPHVVNSGSEAPREFRYYFAQREAIETAVWLYEVAVARDPYSLMRYDATGRVSSSMFDEQWTRYVFKLATGAGKTKVLSLLIAWSYFHKLYESNSPLSRNFLLVAPNIIVLDRLLDDFGGLGIYSADPVLPPDGYGGRDWTSQFQMALHVQDEVGVLSDQGNLFVTNVHRLYRGDETPSSDDSNLTDYFLGRRPVAKTTASVLDVRDIIRGLNDLVVLNDEAHHIHDPKLAWFQAIADLEQGLRRRTGHGLSAQFDVTATPKAESGSIFVQTVSSYPLIEAMRQRVVKTPVLPDAASRSKLHEHASDDVSERYADHIRLGYLEWAKRREDLEALGKKPIMFVMTNTTAEADEVSHYLERTFPPLAGRVLTIHTNQSGAIKEDGTGKAADELAILRQASREIDSDRSPYLAVVSVLMLREGWDVQNVVSMVGLRPYSSKSQVLPEQTLGRGLRRMFRDNPELTEYVSVVGTDAFLDFVESIKAEGVDLDRVPMGSSTTPRAPMLVEVERSSQDKDISALDMVLPKLGSRYVRELKDLDSLDVSAFERADLPLVEFSDAEQRQIIFRDLDTEKIQWATDLGEQVQATPQAVIAYLAAEVMRSLRLVGGQHILYGKIKQYIKDGLFGGQVDVGSPNVLRNLSEARAHSALVDVFTEGINSLTLSDVGTTSVVSEIRLSAVRPMVVSPQDYIRSAKTIFNRVVGDSGLELRFAEFLDGASDVQSFAKNHLGVGFFIEYVNARGDLSHYYPDFFVRASSSLGVVWIVETKGVQDIDVAPKWERLRQWCQDASALDERGRQFKALFVPQEAFYGASASGVRTMKELSELLADSKPVLAGKI